MSYDPDAMTEAVMCRDRHLAEEYAHMPLGPWSSKQEGALSDLANGVLLAQRKFYHARAANAALTEERDEAQHLAGRLREQLDAAEAKAAACPVCSQDVPGPSWRQA